MSEIDKLKKEIEELQAQIDSNRLSPEQVQVADDTIRAKRKKIADLSVDEHKVVPVAAPVVGDQTRKLRIPRMTDNSLPL